MHLNHTQVTWHEGGELWHAYRMYFTCQSRKQAMLAGLIGQTFSPSHSKHANQISSAPVLAVGYNTTRTIGAAGDSLCVLLPCGNAGTHCVVEIISCQSQSGVKKRLIVHLSCWNVVQFSTASSCFCQSSPQRTLIGHILAYWKRFRLKVYSLAA